MRRWVFGCAGLIVCSGCQTVDRTAWYGGFGPLETPAVSSVVHSVQDQSCARQNGGCGTVCSGEAEMPSAPTTLPASPAPVNTWADRPATPPASTVVPPSETTPSPGARRIVVPTAVEGPAIVPGARAADDAPAQTYEESTSGAAIEMEPPTVSSEPLVDVVPPAKLPPRGTSAEGAFGLPGIRYPATGTPDETDRIPADSEDRFDPRQALSDLPKSTAETAADDDGLVPIKKPKPPARPAAKLPAAGAADSRGKPQSSAAPLLSPQFKAGAAVPMPAKGARVDPSKLPQAPILLPAQ